MVMAISFLVIIDIINVLGAAIETVQCSISTFNENRERAAGSVEERRGAEGPFLVLLAPALTGGTARGKLYPSSTSAFDGGFL